VRALSKPEIAELCELVAQDAFCADIVDLATAELRYLEPPREVSTLEYSISFRKIRQGDGETTDWSLSLTPYLAPIMAAIDRPDVNEVLVPKPARSGGTVVAENYALKTMEFGPAGDIMWYLAGPQEVSSYADRVFKPLFEDHDGVAAKIGKGPSDNKLTFKRIGGYSIELMPMSAKTTTNRQGRLIVLDEVDSYQKAFRSNWLEQARQRQRMIGSLRKVYACAHADVGWSGGIAQGWTQSSRGIFIMACAECGGHASPYPTKHWPDTPRFKLDYKKAPERTPIGARLKLARESASMICPHCGVELDDSQRKSMVAEASARGDRAYMHAGQTLDVDMGVMGEMDPTITWGFWIHALMVTQATLAELAETLEAAVEHHERTGKRDKLKQVLVRTFGEVDEGGAGSGSVDASDLRERVKSMAGEDVVRYRMGQIPEGALFVTAAVDVAANRFDILFRAWDLQRRSWLIDRRTIRQRVHPDGILRDIRPTRVAEDWMVLESEVVDRLFPFQDDPSKALPVAVTTIDTGDGNATWNAYEFARRMDKKRWADWRRVRCIKGVGGKRERITGPTKISKDSEGKVVTPVVTLHTLGVDDLKRDVIADLAIEDGSPGMCFFAIDTPKDAYDEFFGETEQDGKWVRSGPNETLDCFDEETEILTRDGWRRFPDLNGEEAIATVNLETRQIEYQRRTDYIERRHTGDMISIKGRRLDILVTPNHRMVTFKKEFNKAEKRWNFDVAPQITLAKDLTIHHQLMMGADWAGTAVEAIEIPEARKERQGSLIAPAVEVEPGDFAEFLGWFVSEGGTTLYRSKTQGNVRRRVMLHQNEGAKAGAIRDLLARLPWQFAELRKPGGTLTWTSSSKQLYDYVVETCGPGVAEKRVPDWIKDATPQVIRRFVDAAIDGDGWSQTSSGQRLHRTYATISAELANGMQELFIKLGCAANIKVRPGQTCSISSQKDKVGRPQYHVSELKRIKASLDGGENGARKCITETVQFDGMVYCVSVPNGTLICRRRGKSFVAGNCYGYAEAGRLMLEPDRKDRHWDDPAKRPIWARPIDLSPDDEPVAGQPAKPKPTKQSLFDRFDKLNQGGR